MSRLHPVTQRVDEAVALHVAWELPVTLPGVKEYVRHNLRHADFTSDEAMEAVINKYAAPRLKTLGYIISAEGDQRERKLQEDCTASEFSVQVEIKQRNLEHVRARFKADRVVEEFLMEKRELHGREVTVGEFMEDIEAIYAEHGISA